MTPKEPSTETRPDDRRRGHCGLPFVVEDHTDEETQAEMAEALAVWQWVQQQRQAGNKPN